LIGYSLPCVGYDVSTSTGAIKVLLFTESEFDDMIVYLDNLAQKAGDQGRDSGWWTDGAPNVKEQKTLAFYRGRADGISDAINIIKQYRENA